MGKPDERNPLGLGARENMENRYKGYGRQMKDHMQLVYIQNIPTKMIFAVCYRQHFYIKLC